METPKQSRLMIKAKKILDDLDAEANTQNYGQHFLIDEKSIRLFVEACALTGEKHVLEIGPGLGFITKELLSCAASVHSIDVDSRLKSVLSDIQSSHHNFSYAFENALTRENYSYDVVCGALSYALFEPLMRVLIFKRDFLRAVFVVSEKFKREYEEKENAFALAVSAFFEVQFQQVLAKELFYPQPRHAGILVMLTPHDKTDLYSTVLRQIFLQHDKKLKNALREAFITSAELLGKTLTKKQSKAYVLGYVDEKVLEEPVFQIPKNATKSLIQCIDRFVEENK